MLALNRTCHLLSAAVVAALTVVVFSSSAAASVILLEVPDVAYFESIAADVDCSPVTETPEYIRADSNHPSDMAPSSIGASTSSSVPCLGALPSHVALGQLVVWLAQSGERLMLQAHLRGLERPPKQR